MNKRSLRILEFHKIQEQLATFAGSKGAKKKCLNIKAMTEEAQIEIAQQNTRDAFLRLEHDGNVAFAGIHDVRESEKLLEIGSTLSSQELLNIASLLDAASTVKEYGCGSTATDTLSEKFSFITPLTDVSGEIRRCILSQDEFADDASSTLQSIRRKITSANAKLHSELEKIIKSSSMQDMLMEQLITTRGGRYCIPVKVEYKNSFPGMIHDRSATGSTLFIEPISAVNLNNEITELHDDERAEIQKILNRLSGLAASAREQIHEDYDLLVELDFIFAKAKYAREIHASQPTFNHDKIVDLKAAIHPLLERHKAVPIDLKIGETYSSLIITGPNTGGKTVSLKTLGLLSLMAQAGLHIPALAGSRLPIFSDIFADIGDEQSIEQNLSTFSSHMSNIIFIVEHADENSLCLFDEPGGGTDPAEGAALAIAILNALKARGTTTMATTHYTELKTYAIAEPGVENASCEFDLKTLRPTYHLMIGVPGSSNAFAIAKRLGMPDEITDAARQNLSDEQIKMEKVIADLEEARKEAASDRAEVETLKIETNKLRQSLTDKNKNLDKKRNEILHKAKKQAEEILAEAKDTADQAIRDYNKWLKNPAKADARRMEEERAALRDKMSKMESKKAAPKAKISGQKASDFHIGDKVLVLNLDTEGYIVAEADSKGRLQVQMGILKSAYKPEELLILPEDPAPKDNHATRRAMRAASSSKAMTFNPEINLLGCTVDEGISQLEKFLDDAMLTHIAKVRIVHGKGTGALRTGIHNYLKKQSFIKSYHLAEYGEGDAGVTIVEFK